MSRRSLNSRLFRWHGTSRRPLLIREAADPWQVLVAEVMSQQTGIERVGPAWRRFVDRWPTPADLAEAGTHELLAAWAGLGYNRRALALRECARTIVADHGGRVPATVAELDALPGIGPYTARAVAASAFGVPVAPLDVNVRRVVSRLLGVPSSSSGTPGGGRRPGVARSARSLARCRHGSRLGNVYRPRAAVRRVSRRRPVRFARGGRRHRAEGRRRPVRDDLPMAARSSGRGRDRGARGDLGGRSPNGWATTTPTPSTWPRGASNAKGSSTSRRGRRECGSNGVPAR